MRRTLFAAPALLVAAGIAGLLYSGEPEGKSGHLAVVGGGKIPPEIRRKILEVAGGRLSRVLVVPQASEDPETGAEAAAFWKEAEPKGVAILDLTDAAAALAAVRESDLIWITGGDQNRLMKTLAKTGIPAAIRERLAGGGTVGGTSAGAAAMSALMLTGDDDLESVTAGTTKTAEGLGLWPDVIVDQHFLARRRFNRLLAAVLDHPKQVGIGIDEGTAVIVTGPKFEVIGRSAVVILDAREAKVPPTEPGRTGAATDVRIHILREGMAWNLADRGEKR